MDFRFTEEQDMMAEVLRSLLSDKCQAADLRRLMQSQEPRDADRWQALAELGFEGILVAEEAGGLGLKAIDFVQIAQAAGYAGLPEPLVENAGVAIPLLAAIAPEHPVLAQALAAEFTLAIAHEANLVVADADTAGAILVAKGDSVELILAKDATLTRQESVDPFRRLFTVEGKGEVIAQGDHVKAAIAQAFDRGALFAAAQMLGLAQRSIDLGVDYSKERRQFGKPIGSYQAVKHQLATAQVKIEFARPVLQAAAAQLERGDLLSRSRISQAKLAAGEAADLAARTSVQVHGAMGYSWEVDVHFFLKRGIALNSFWGTPAVHRKRVAERVFNGPLGPDSTFAKEA